MKSVVEQDGFPIQSKDRELGGENESRRRKSESQNEGE
jgi:hypothetical protein